MEEEPSTTEESDVNILPDSLGSGPLEALSSTQKRVCRHGVGFRVWGLGLGFRV